MEWIEPIAAVFGLLCVILTIRQHIACWPLGLVQVSLYCYVFYEARLYSDLLLHAIYIVLQFYGWHFWLHGGRGRSEAPVTRLRSVAILAWVALAATSAAGWGWLMDTRTDAALPYADAFIASASLVAQWLLSRKKLESWGFWIAVDLVAIVVYWSRDLRYTALLYAVFLALAIAGLESWRRAHVRGATLRAAPVEGEVRA
jgi:nicotinamide mononucleotide transporter